MKLNKPSYEYVNMELIYVILVYTLYFVIVFVIDFRSYSHLLERHFK